MTDSVKNIDGKTRGISVKYVVPIIVVAALIIVVALAVSADGDTNNGSANDDVIYVYPCGKLASDDVKAYWNSGTGVMTIKGIGPMADFRVGGFDENRPWKDFLNRIRSVVVTEGVTSIGDKAFYGCEGLNKLTFAKNCDTEVGYETFYMCQNLTTVTFEEGSKLTYVGRMSFYLCGIRSMMFPDGLEDIEDFAFNGCVHLESVRIPDGVKSIGEGSFNACKLRTVVIPNSVESIGDRAFYQCHYLRAIAIGEKVKDISPVAFPNHVFYDGDVKITDMSKLAGKTFNAKGMEEGRIKMVKVEVSPTPTPDIQTLNPILMIILAAIAAIIVVTGLTVIYVRRK